MNVSRLAADPRVLSLGIAVSVKKFVLTIPRQKLGESSGIDGIHNELLKIRTSVVLPIVASVFIDILQYYL